MKYLLIVYGTRPEYIKIKSIIDNIKIPYKLLFTGQHKHIVSSNADRTLTIKEGSNRLDSILQSSLNNEDIFKDISYVMVQGDTTSAMSLALAAFHRNIPIIHLEAGLRTNDIQNPYPEESNRQIISSIASIHLCPTQNNKNTLLQEKKNGMIYVVGNTGLDNIDKKGCSYGNEVIITLHRRENHPIIDKYFKILDNLAKTNKDLTFTLPIHPNPNVQKHRHLLKHVNVIEPIPHNEMVQKLKTCKFVISDSGGLQEECSFLNKKIIVCRETTERPESIGIHSFMCPNPKMLKKLFYGVLNDFQVDAPCPYGDGKSSRKIVEILGKLFR